MIEATNVLQQGGGFSMPINREFRTVRGYEMLKQQDKNTLSPSMEDYLEMIYRSSLEEEGVLRVNHLAEQLNVQAPSVTRTMQKLADLGLVYYHKYGVIQLTPNGTKLGKYLYYRHRTVEEFLRNLGVGENLFIEAELIEHHLSRDTISIMTVWNRFFAEYPEIRGQFDTYFNTKENEGNNEEHPTS